jgi:hypothetical protein
VLGKGEGKGEKEEAKCVADHHRRKLISHGAYTLRNKSAHTDNGSFFLNDATVIDIEITVLT